MRTLLGRLAHQSPAMSVAMLALFVALSGTAVATTSAVITGRQIANNSITGIDVKNKSLGPADFKGSVRGAPGADGAPGSPGQPGARGPKGDKGDQGETGATGANGAQGLDGPQGSQGLQGPQGLDGPQGPRGFQGLQGSPGQPGATGPQGPQGPQGPAGFSDVYIETRVVSTPPSTVEIDSVTCLRGATYKVTGGGYEIHVGYEPYAQVVDSRPLGGGNGWAVRMRNNGNSQALQYTIWAICVK